MNQSISLPPDHIYCSDCESAISKQAKYCPHCGNYQNYQYEQDLKEQRETQWNTLKEIIIFYSVYLITMVPLLWFRDRKSAATAMLVVSFVDVVVILIYWIKTKVSLLSQFRFDKIVRKYLLIGLACLLPVLALNFFYHHIIIKLFSIEDIQISDAFTEAGFGPMVVIFATSLMPAFWEEIAFRGLIQSRLVAIFTPKRAILVTAALFAIIHVTALSWPYLFFLGLVLGILRYYSKSLWPTIAFHFFHNLIITLIEMFSGGTF